ncbi:MAG: hypothetical protein FJY16_00320 [Bacteroidetes bacterium]|nr:hypothetical protein [Bacteroidota bacterium]
MGTEPSRLVQRSCGVMVLMALFFPFVANALSRDTLIRKISSSKTDVLNAGFIDLVSSGQVSASARLIRLRIGEPDKFSLPFTIYSGVSNNAFSAQILGMAVRNNEHLVTQFITPLSGLLNVSVDGWRAWRKKEKITQFGFIYQLGERLLTGYRTTLPGSWLNGRPHNFLNSFATLGLFFQTGAWEKDHAANMGACWISIRYHLAYTHPSQLAVFLEGLNTNGTYRGYSMGFGLEISYTVHLKAQVYRYTKPPEPLYSLPLYQFSFNYALQGKN